MDYTRFDVFSVKYWFHRAVIALNISFDGLIDFLVCLCNTIGSSSVSTTYYIFDAFVKIIVATKSQANMDTFHSFILDLIGKNRHNDSYGSTKTTKSIFYEAFKMLQGKLNESAESAYYLSDDGFLSIKGSPNTNLQTKEQEATNIAMGKSTNETMRGTDDKGQINIVI